MARVRKVRPKSNSKKLKKRALSTNKSRDLLPRCTGPKLHPFLHSQKPIDFIRQIDDDDAGHSHVFEVMIAGRSYALKVVRSRFPNIHRFVLLANNAILIQFNFHDNSNDEDWQQEYKGRFPEGEGLPSNHYDPFYAECRAYGAIINAGLNGRITPTCYGYMMLSKDQDEKLMKTFNRPDFKRYLNSSSPQRPLRAIVKELVPAGTPSFTRRHVRQMLKDIRTLVKIGVYTDDLAVRNYLDGRLIDFSAAYTKPHVDLSYGLRSDWHVWYKENRPFMRFDGMIILDTNFNSNIRAIPNYDYCKKLRVKTLVQSSLSVKLQAARFAERQLYKPLSGKIGRL